MYRSRPGQSIRRSGRRRLVDVALLVSTVVFWIAAPIFVALMASYFFTGSVGTASSWPTGVSLLLVAVSSGAITWVEFRNNSPGDAEHGEWTN